MVERPRRRRIPVPHHAETSANLAFFTDDAFAIESWRLEDRIDILTDLVLRHGFTMGWNIEGA
jgi:hypothetical protein